MALPTILTTTSLSVLLLALASFFATAVAAPSPNAFTDILLPTLNVTDGPAGEIQCYALPYGAVGIVSHLLTYWTFAWIALGKVPLWPWADMDTWQFDLFLSIATLCTCIPTATITIHRCRLSWHFVLISIRKLVTSVSMACMSINRCILVRREKKAEQHPNCNEDTVSTKRRTLFKPHKLDPKNPKKTDITPLWWVVLYIVGTIVGMIGLCPLLWTSFRQDETVRGLTYGFAAPILIIPCLVAIFWYLDYAMSKEEEGGAATYRRSIRHVVSGAFIAFVATFGFFSALYGDMVLGAITNNGLGLPSADYAPLYWVWFAAKRFALMCF